MSKLDYYKKNFYNLVYGEKIKNKIVIGTWPLSGDYGIIKPSDVEKVLIKSFENGFKEFDTAPSMEMDISKIY